MRENLYEGRYQNVEGTPSARIQNEKLIPDHKLTEQFEMEVPQLGSKANRQIPVSVE